MNRDGVPELVVAAFDGGAGSDISAEFAILEWDGVAFRDLVQRGEYDAGVLNGGDIVTDTDGNGTLELVIKGGMDRGNSAADAGPQRDRTDIWAWNAPCRTLLMPTTCARQP
jgi:hypothetical protein